jgi:uncharacterized protein YyaL (SSP411 family)
LALLLEDGTLKQGSQMATTLVTLVAALAAGASFVALEREGGADVAPAAAAAPAPSPSQPDGPLPGSLPRPPDVERALQARWQQTPASYEPRTKHLREDGAPRFTNRLFLETSPYLRQHAHNPVDWFPWGDEAFALAKKLGRPVLLSVGYSTCHWCHVMEEESFEDEEIAAFLNRHYIAIKVDREERPDVDSVYMTAVYRLTGRGGWPMTAWLTPDREPFHAGTYFPARDGDRGASTGFLTLLQRLHARYVESPAEIVGTARNVAASIAREMAGGAPTDIPSADVIDVAAASYRSMYDAQEGGLQRAPKFPSQLAVRFLLRAYRRAGDAQLRDMAVHTLQKMAAGGMYDQVGGGFHRYATDRHWLVPHFEKMLYDNALLVVAYLEAYQATGREDLLAVARDVLRYVERDMTSPAGAFYSATDADSLVPGGHREEGWFFTWTPIELEAALGAQDAKLATAYWNVTEGGNFEHRNILHVKRPLAEVAAELGMTRARARARLDVIREELYQTRARRPAPLRDEKILTAWNGLMITAFARAHLVTREARYAEVAARAATFLLDNLRKDGRLLRTWKDGRARLTGYLDDYAFFIEALITLYEATGEERWLREAVALEAKLTAHYAAPSGAYYLTADDAEKLLAREIPDRDGAQPSGNSVHALNLLRLAELTADDNYRQRADGVLRGFGRRLARSPTALSEMLHALDWRHDRATEVVIALPRGASADAGRALLDELRGVFLPSLVTAVVEEGASWPPVVEGKVAQGGQPTAYVCERGACQLPTGKPARLAKQLDERGAVRP